MQGNMMILLKILKNNFDFVVVNKLKL